MNSQSLTNWIQIGATLFVAAGIVLVILEMQQAKQIATAGLIESSTREIIHSSRAVGGEQIAESIARSCTTPADMTATDFVVLDRYFESQHQQVNAIRYTAFVGGYDADWLPMAKGIYRSITASEHGRWWLKRKLSRLEQGNTEGERDIIRNQIITEAVESPKEDCSTFIDAFMHMK